MLRTASANGFNSVSWRERRSASHTPIRPAHYYSWSKEFLEAGKRRLAGDTARSATTSEIKDLKRQALELKEVVAEQALELRLLKKSMTGDGGDEV
jgi:transposase-like protein